MCRMVGAPDVSGSPGSRDTTTMLWDVAGWGELNSRALCAIAWFPMSAGTTELYRETIDVSPLLLPNSITIMRGSQIFKC